MTAADDSNTEQAFKLIEDGFVMLVDAAQTDALRYSMTVQECLARNVAQLRARIPKFDQAIRMTELTVKVGAGNKSLFILADVCLGRARRRTTRY